MTPDDATARELHVDSGHCRRGRRCFYYKVILQALRDAQIAGMEAAVAGIEEPWTWEGDEVVDHIRALIARERKSDGNT